MAITDKTISVIGLGRFGTLIATILSKKFEVLIYNHKENKEMRELAEKTGAKPVDYDTAAQADIVVLCVPISKTEQVIKDISKKMKSGALLLDTCSVKILPCKWLLDNTPRHIEIIGTHPMFGPTTAKFNLEEKSYAINDKQIVLCPIRINPARLERLKNYFDSLGLDVIETTPDDHDEQNARTLSLVHFLGRSLNKANIHEQRIFTPGYIDLLKISPHTNSDNWQLFFDMNNFNPFAGKIRRQFMEACDAIEDKIIESKTSDEFDYQRLLIDKIDKNIIRLLEKRFTVAKKIGKIKKDRGLKIFDPEREKIVLDKIAGISGDIDHEFIKRLYRSIMDEAKKYQ